MGVANDADLQEAAGHEAIDQVAHDPSGIHRDGSDDDQIRKA